MRGISTKKTADSLHRIDIRILNKYNQLQSGETGDLTWAQGGNQTGSILYIVEDDALLLIDPQYNTGRDKGEFETRIYFDWTDCNYGGKRTWFLCPDCKERRLVMYKVENQFRCRSCNNLSYRSQKKDTAGRLILKAQNIRQQLGGSGSLFDKFPPRPKGMHRKTYIQIRVNSLNLEEQAFGHAAKKCGSSG